MSQTQQKRRNTRTHAANTPFYGISLWVSLAILLGALLAGMIFSILMGAIGWPMLALLIFAAILTALITEPRALFLLVSSMPILFGVFILATSWFIVTKDSPGAQTISRTQVITAAFPLTQHFPTIALASVGAALIAVLRIALLRRQARATSTHAIQTRRHHREAQERNYSAAAKSRRQAQSAPLTVQELMQRQKQRQRPTRAASLDSPSQRGARTYAPHPQRSAERLAKQAPEKAAEPQPRVEQPQNAKDRGRSKHRKYHDDLYS